MNVQNEPKRTAVAFRLLTPTAQLLQALAVEMGISQTSVVEMMVRDLAKKRGVKAKGE